MRLDTGMEVEAAHEERAWRSTRMRAMAVEGEEGRE